MQTLERNAVSEYDFCLEVMQIDTSIRFVGWLCKCGRLKAYARRKGIEPMLNLPETKIVYREAVLKSKMNRVFDVKLGRTRWSVECRDGVKWITVYLSRDLLLLSMGVTSNHDVIIQKILCMINSRNIS